MEEKLYTVQEAAQQLGVSDSHVRNMIRTGKAHPTRRIGHMWVFTPEEIEQMRIRRTRTKQK